MFLGRKKIFLFFVFFGTLFARSLHCSPSVKSVMGSQCFALEVIERMNDVFEPVHVVPVDVPVSHVPVRRVLDVPDLLGHDGPGGGRRRGQALLQHGHLKLAQDLRQRKEKSSYSSILWPYSKHTYCFELELCLVEFFHKESIVEYLVQHDLFQSHRKALEIRVDFSKRIVHLKNKGIPR